MKKTRELTRNQFAKFIANKLLKLKAYNFDLFYDIARITEEHKKQRANYKEPVQTTFHLFLRDTGSDLIDMADIIKEKDTYKIMKERSIQIYRLRFTFNCDNFYNVPFVIITKIK